MSWAVGEFNGRDIGYGVPATCDHPDCGARIDRGLAYVCGGEVYGGTRGCGLFFCDLHRAGEHELCARCAKRKPPFIPTPDVPEWIAHKETDESWAAWRAGRDGRASALAEQVLGRHAP